MCDVEPHVRASNIKILTTEKKKVFMVNTAGYNKTYLFKVTDSFVRF